MINVLVIVMEAITMWLCLHIAFGEKIKKNGWVIVYFVVCVFLYYICYYLNIHSTFGFLMFVVSGIWARIVLHDDIKCVVWKTTVAVVLLALVEIISMFAYSLFLNYFDSIEIQSIIGTVLSVLFSTLLYCLINYKHKQKTKYLYGKNVVGYTLIFFMFLLIVKIEYEINNRISLVFIIYFLILAVAFFLLYNNQKYIFKLRNKNIALELQSVYGQAYEELLNEVRKKQHDFKNQLYAINSMHIATGSYDELVEMQTRYIGMLEKDGYLDTVLLKCDNSILAGYLYSICDRYKKKNIDISVNVVVGGKEIDIKTKDVIEILGVLLNNAYESVEEMSLEDKCIKIFIREDRNIYFVEVSNVSKPLSNVEIEEMFAFGKSTKGNHSGIGLNAVKDVVNKYLGDIIVEKCFEENRHWIKFMVKL